MRMEALHKPGIAIYAAIRAARVAVEGVITNTGAIQQTLAGDLTDNRPLHRGQLYLSGTVSMLEQTWLLMSGHEYKPQLL